MDVERAEPTRVQRVIARLVDARANPTMWSTVAAVAAISGLIGVSWIVAVALGGAGPVAPHWFYIPIFLAGLWFGPLGALVAAAVATFVAGPLLPSDVATLPLRR
jgi:hypothetical protein